MLTFRRLLFALSIVLAPAASALAQVCPAGSTCATLDSYAGGHIALGGALTTAGALTTTGAASGATLALPVGGPFTFTLPSTSKTLLATDLSNIGAGILPVANLTALTASHFFAGDVSNRPIDASITGDMGCGTAAAGFVTCTVTGIRGTSIAAIGTGVPTALGINVGTAGSFLTNGSALAGSSLTSTGLIKTTGADGSQLEIAGAGLTDFKLSVNASGFYVNDVTNSKSPLIVSANSPNSLTIGTSTNAFIGPLTDGANGGTVGSLKLFGNTSGDVTLVAAAAAGTATRFQLPATNGSNTNVLQTDGSGNTSWVAAGGGAVSLSASTANLVFSPNPITGTGTIGTIVALNAQSGNSAYTILAGDNTKAVSRTNTVTQSDIIPQATGSFASGFAFGYSTGASVGNTLTATTSTVNGIAGATGIKVGIEQEIGCNSDGTNWACMLGLPQPTTQTGTTVLRDDMTWTTFGTAGAAATGTSGHTLPYLDGANTFSGTQTFGSVIGSLVTDSSTARTVSAADCGKTIYFTNAGAIAYTLLNSTPVGCAIAVMQGPSAGQVTITVGASGATLISAHSYTKTFGVNAIVGIFVNTNSGTNANFVLTGDGA